MQAQSCLFSTPWTGFSRQEYWSGYPFLSPGHLPNPGIEPRSLTLQADSLPAEPLGKPNGYISKSENNWDIAKDYLTICFDV